MTPAEQRELEQLRIETAQQRKEIKRLKQVNADLARADGNTWGGNRR